MSAFKTWFVKQFGAAPDTGHLRDLQRRLDSLRRETDIVESAIATEQYLARAWDAALYGWNARKK